VLAFVLTLILAVYILGPDLFFRFVVSLFAPAQVRSRNQSEEVARAVFLSIIPVFCAWFFAHYFLHRFNNTAVLMDFLRGLYGEDKAERADTFLNAATTVLS
jgi:ABC-type enterochelin transport system permease subunit